MGQISWLSHQTFQRGFTHDKLLWWTTKIGQFCVSCICNVTIHETIEIIAYTIYAPLNKERLDLPPILKSDFKYLLYLATQSLFKHENKQYQLLNVVAIGSPLGPTLANYLEKPSLKWFLSTITFEVYVDGIIAIFNENEHSQQFLNALNYQHRNIKFTMENSRRQFWTQNFEKTNL